MNTDYIRSWIEHDPDPATAKELTKLLARAENADTEAIAKLESAFSGPLTFGTAGLRGTMGAGETRMNSAVVRRAAAGLVAYMREHAGDDAVLVIGYDARYYSHDFAHDTAAIAHAAGIRAMIMPRALPTPLLAYAVRALGADAGVMVTASHNPAQDNGYKVYLGGRCSDEAGRGVQLVPPADAQIAAAIAAAPAACDIALSEGYTVLPDSIVDDYMSAISSLIPEGFSSNLSLTYTAMHGVGAQVMLPVLDKAGFSRVSIVDEQCTPDPDFPTVAFPNPEEAGALDMAMAHARQNNSDIIIASDPDADRCSIAVRAADGEYRQLSGDEIGTILGYFIASTIPTDSSLRPTFASSIVSSRLLEKIAHGHGLEYSATLTGFKWIARTPHLTFGYEEAIGFCVLPDTVRDKDGISAGLLLAFIADTVARSGKTLLDYLDDIYSTYGMYMSAPVTVRVDDISRISATMSALRTQAPAHIGGSALTHTIDVSEADNELNLPASDVLIWHTEAGDRIIVRPSGTEPKVKCYIDVYEAVDSAKPVAVARAAAQARMGAIQADMRTLLGA